jgi:SAM-dependent methyltransferase
MTTDPATATAYFAADAEAADELARLQLLEAEQDPQTLRCLAAIGIGEGWRCLEVGAGAGSVVRWLSARAGDQGRVVAADVDLRFLNDLAEPNVEARQCDITRDEVEPGCYDLVHCRNLLMHLDNPGDVLRRMLAALRPGGWLLAEDPDLGVAGSADRAHPMSGLFDSYWARWIEFVSAEGILDPRFGKTLPGYVEAAGLVDLSYEGVAKVVRGGEPHSLLWIRTWQRTNDAVIAKGVLSESQIADMRRAFEDPTFIYRSLLMQSVWGRKPASEAF